MKTRIDTSREKISNPRTVEVFKVPFPTDTALRTNGFDFDSLDVGPVKFAMKSTSMPVH